MAILFGAMHTHWTTAVIASFGKSKCPETSGQKGLRFTSYEPQTYGLAEISYDYSYRALV